MSRTYAQQKRPGAKAVAPSYDAPAVHAPSLVSGQSSSDLDAMMQAKFQQHFLDNQIPTAEAEADSIAASVSDARTPEEVKTQLGEKMGADFSNVTFHTDSAALKQADAMGARAYTTGSDIYFGQGGFDPGVAAHELVHTVQQGMVGSTMGTVSAPTGGVQMKLGRRREAKGASSSNLLRNSLFGSFAGRSRKSNAVSDFANMEPFQLEGKGINNTNLTGLKFHPTGVDPQGRPKNNGKSVIVYAGTHTNGLDQMKDTIKQYTDEGFTVYQMDYRGYGENSGKHDEDFQVSEQSLHEDAHALFEHVQQDQGADKTNNDIILHGFSMGGAIASRLAADISEQAAANCDNKQKLGGLTLHSSMRNLKHAASGSFGKGPLGWLAGWISKRHLGRFSTKQALQDIAKVDPTLPVNLISGGSTGKNTDSLNLKETGLEKAARDAGLRDVTAAQGSGKHLNKEGTAPKEHFGSSYYNQLKRGKKLWKPRSF